MNRFLFLLCFVLLCLSWSPRSRLQADVGDPQIKTDHPWYPGELAISTFDRLAATQASVYEREIGRKVTTDEDKALASWYWRNLHYAHCQEGVGDYFDAGFGKGQWNREYWHGLFAHGMSLCGTTHCQWTAEMQALLGHCRSRCVGVSGHNSFEVYLKGGEYGQGKWALLDHDVSTVIFGKQGKRLLSIDEIRLGDKNLRDNQFHPDRQRGWRISGLHEKDVVNLYDSYRAAEYLAGYAGPPPMVHLRRGESLRRYIRPGLDDGKTMVFWGSNRVRNEMRGPQRDRTWVNQPDKMFQASRNTGSVAGRVRYANAVYTYQPRFDDNSFREAMVHHDSDHPNNDQVIFEFNTPYVIAATPPNDKLWGVYDQGCTNGLVVTGNLTCDVSVTTDCGQTWQTNRSTQGRIDFTDQVKGHQQYQIRFDCGASSLANTGLTITTVCQMNTAVIPRLKSGANRITYQASGRALYSAGPNQDQAEAHIIDGSIDDVSGVTLELDSPRGEVLSDVFASSHNLSGNPPNPDITYGIEYSTDDGSTWDPMVKDWNIQRREPEPADHWSQSFTYGAAQLPESTKHVRVRFRNTGRKRYRRVEAHVAYRVANPTTAKVTFAWTENQRDFKQATREMNMTNQEQEWTIDTRGEVETKWVEIAVE